MLIIHRGRLVSEGEPSDLRGGAAGKQIVRIEGRGALEAFEKAFGALGCEVSELRVVSGEGERALVRARLDATDDADLVERVFSAVAEAGLVLRELRRQEASLEDVFADLTTEDVGEDEEAAGEAAEEDSDAAEEEADHAEDDEDDEEAR